MSNREKDIWRELDRIAFGALAFGIALFSILYYIIGISNPIEGTPHYILQGFFLNVIANLIATLLIYAVSRGFLRRIQALQSQHKDEELASMVSAQIVGPLRSDLSEIKEDIEALGQDSPARFLQARRKLTRTYEEKTTKATEVDIIALTMEVLLSHYSEDHLVQWILHEGKRIRILVLSPNALAAGVRGREEGIDLAAKIMHQMHRLRRLYNKILERIKDCSGQCKGYLEVRTYDGIPYFAYFRADEDMIIGLYYSHLEGLDSECIHLNESEHLVFQKMKGHFDTLWSGKTEGSDSDIEGRVVCRVSSSGLQFAGVKGLSNESWQFQTQGESKNGNLDQE
jgi:hypothetical protein